MQSGGIVRTYGIFFKIILQISGIKPLQGNVRILGAVNIYLITLND